MVRGGPSAFADPARMGAASVRGGRPERLPPPARPAAPGRRASRRLRHVLLASCLLLAACDPGAVGDAPALPPASTAAEAAAEASGRDVTVAVVLSEPAARLLASERLGLRVEAEWFGYPTIAAQQRGLVETGDPWLGLHRERRELDGAGRVRFRSPEFDPERLALLEQGRPHLLVTVSAAEDAADAGGDALLDCGTFQDRLAVAVRDGVVIDCRLAAE